MTGAKRPHARVWQGDVHEGYRDPEHPPKGHASTLGYVPEMHASARCERALKGGRTVTKPPATSPWCDLCVTPDPNAATHRRDPNDPDPHHPEWGRWKRVNAA